MLRLLMVAASVLSATGPSFAQVAPPAPGAGGPSSADELRLASSLAGLAARIDGPPPPVAPEVLTRDERGRATVRAIRLTEALQVDGRLDERVYGTAMPITGFVQNVPDVGRPASEKTEAWIFFDRDHIYVAARCWDTAPESEWVANEMRRDAQQLRQNDNFGMLFDTYYDRRNGYQFYANALGGFVDQQITNEGNANKDWNPVWNVRTGRFEGGWTVEMQIPFKSLRYRPGASQIWGLQLRRTVRRRNEYAYLTALPLSAAGSNDGSLGIFRVSMAGTLVGLEVPPGSRNLEVKPYGIGGLRTDRGGSHPVDNDLNRDVGVDVKYGVTQNATLDFTYNTDFAQVEVDEQQINLTRFNLVFPEKREFFLEGRGIFDFARGSVFGGGSGGQGGGLTPQLFFSRQIGLQHGQVVPIVAGARLTGKLGGLTMGALNIHTDRQPASTTPETNFTVLRLKQDLLRRSSLGVLLTARSQSTVAEGRSNQTYGLDGSFSFYENVSFNGYYARTETPGLAGRPESYQARFDYSADRYGVTAEHLFVGDAFNPEVGFVRRDDMRRNFAAVRVSPRPASLTSVRRFIWEASGEQIENAAGAVETRQYSTVLETEFENSDRFSFDASHSDERLIRPFRIAPGVTIPVGLYAFNNGRASFLFGQQRRLSGSVAFQYGDFYDGELKAVEYSQGRLEVTPQLSLEPSASVNRIDLPAGSFTTQLYRTRVNYTFTPRMFLSGLLQYNSTSDTVSTNLRLRWEYSPGSELFIVYTEDRETDAAAGRFSELQNRALVIKANRLLRF